MSRDEMELDKMGGYKKLNPKTGEYEVIKQKTALFVIISDTDSSFNFIVALMYSQLFNILCDTADNDFGGRLPVHVRFLLDEFSNIGLIPNFEKLIATIRSREISASVILQALSQLRAIYKDNMDTIVGNCDTTLFLGGQEKTTLKDMSEMLGQETIDLYNVSITKGTQESHGQNFQKLGKALMSVDEFTNIRHYTDDDESGRFFDRSGYVQMIDDVESGKIGIVVMKDLTRWGRDHVQVGIAMEIFRKNNVRFIAINHGIDSIDPTSLEMAPFINIMSEWYANDCSKKVKSAYKAKGMSGKPLSLPPYGYMKSPDNKDFWVVDEPAAEVVRRVYQLTMDGYGLNQISNILTKDKVLVPSHYLKMTGNSKWQKNVAKDPYLWGIHAVERILTKQEYCGDVVNFKTSKHVKDKRSSPNDQSQWQIFENIHEPIIDRATFENAQRVYKSMKKKRADKNGKFHPLAGLIYCSSCGGKMYIFRAVGISRIWSTRPPKTVHSAAKNGPI